MLAVQQGQVFLGSLASFWAEIWKFLPAVILALILFIIGIILANLIGKAVAHVINLTKVNGLLEKTELKNLVNKAGYHLDVGGLIGWLIKWFLIIGFLFAALGLLHLDAANAFLGVIITFFFSQVLAAVIILIIGSVLANIAGKLVSGSARVANVMSANLAGTVTHWAIWIATILFALNQLGIAQDFIKPLWIGIVAAFALAFGLAFGLGCKEHAARALDRLSNTISRN
jgi:hypothetical protein